MDAAPYLRKLLQAIQSLRWITQLLQSFLPFNDRKEASAAMAAARQHMRRVRRCGITQPSSLASDPLVDGQKARRSTRYFN